MDDFDDFLNEAAASVTLTAPTSAPEADQNQDQDQGKMPVTISDDDFEALLSDKPLEVVNTITSTGTPQPVDTNDFLSWLGDTDSVSPIKSLNLVTLDKSHLTPNTAEKSGSDKSMDNFFDEVFGDDIDTGKNVQLPTKSNLRVDVAAANGVASSSDVSSSGQSEFQSLKYPSLTRSISTEEEVFGTVDSTFPDVPRLRTLLLEAGYIPGAIRGKVWCILLNGFFVEDQEAKDFRCTGIELANFEELKADCDAVINSRVGSLWIPPDIEASRASLKDILVLYCVRREIEYHHVLCNILAPLLVSPHPMPRGLSYSCFYALCSGFIPMINLHPHAFSRAMNKISDWVRLLLVYHFPTLSLHLDRTLPGWEQLANNTSTSEAEQISSQIAADAGLDDLERAMGIMGLGVSPCPGGENAPSIGNFSGGVGIGLS